MNNFLNNTPAAELAANFQVTELEPRLENAWAGGADGSEVEHPTGGTGL